MRSRALNSCTRWSARTRAFSALAVNLASALPAEAESSESTKVASSLPKRTDSDEENQFSMARIVAERPAAANPRVPPAPRRSGRGPLLPGALQGVLESGREGRFVHE